MARMPADNVLARRRLWREHRVLDDVASTPNRVTPNARRHPPLRDLGVLHAGNRGVVYQVGEPPRIGRTRLKWTISLAPAPLPSAADLNAGGRTAPAIIGGDEMMRRLVIARLPTSIENFRNYGRAASEVRTRISGGRDRRSDHTVAGIVRCIRAVKHSRRYHQ